MPIYYTLDINRGLTQVLTDGTNTYLYGLGRIGEQQPSGWQYQHGDALGTVRRLTDASTAVTAAMHYEPFGSTLTSTGTASTNYAFTGEWADGTGLVHLRARQYDPRLGSFLSRDLWSGDMRVPSSGHDWAYAAADPINRVDPSGLCPLIMPEVDYQECIKLQLQLKQAQQQAKDDQRLSEIVNALNRYFYRGSISSGNRNRWESDYLSLERNVTHPPPGITWNPSIQMNDSPNIAQGANQYALTDELGDPLRRSTGEEINGSNYCGQIVLSVILGTQNQGYRLAEIIEAINLTKTTGGADLAVGVRDVFGRNWDYWIYTYNSRFKIDHDGERTNQTVLSRNWFSAAFSTEYPVQLRQILKRGAFPVLLTQIMPQSEGNLRPFSISRDEARAHGVASTVGHWVLLTGMSSTFNVNDRDDFRNWVRIYNPFRDRSEYYYWGEFRRSVNSGVLLEIWRRPDWSGRLPR